MELNDQDAELLARALAHAGVARSVLGRFAAQAGDAQAQKRLYEALQVAAVEGLLEAERTFRPGKASRLTWSHRCVERHLFATVSELLHLAVQP